MVLFVLSQLAIQGHGAPLTQSPERGNGSSHLIVRWEAGHMGKAKENIRGDQANSWEDGRARPGTRVGPSFPVDLPRPPALALACSM